MIRSRRGKRTFYFSGGEGLGRYWWKEFKSNGMTRNECKIIEIKLSERELGDNGELGEKVLTGVSVGENRMGKKEYLRS